MGTQFKSATKRIKAGIRRNQTLSTKILEEIPDEPSQSQEQANIQECQEVIQAHSLPENSSGEAKEKKEKRKQQPRKRDEKGHYIKLSREELATQKEQAKQAEKLNLEMLSQSEKDLILECANDISTFAAVFLPHYVTREFSESFHIELFRLLGELARGKQDTKNVHKTSAYIDTRRMQPNANPSRVETREQAIQPPTLEEWVNETKKEKTLLDHYADTLRGIREHDTLKDPHACDVPITALPNAKPASPLGSSLTELKLERGDPGSTLPGGVAGERGVKSNLTPKTIATLQENALENKKPIAERAGPKGKSFDCLAIAAPRGHSKTTIVSLVFPLWCIVYRLHKYVLLVSDSEEQAKLLLDAIRSELEMNDRLKRCYGDLVGDRTWGELAIETSSGIRVQCRSAYQKIRGLKFREERPGLVIVDDVENDQMMDSQDLRIKLKRWFYGSLLPAKKIGGKVVAIGTILHEDSLLKELLETWESRKFSADVNNSSSFETPLWPQAFTTDMLLELKEEYQKRGQLDIFYREYMNEIISKEEAPFQKSYFKYIDAQELIDMVDRGISFRTFLTIDPAYSIKNTSDFTAFVVAMVDEKRNLYIRECIREKMSMTQIMNKWFDLMLEYAPACGMQSIDWDKSFKRPMQEEMTRRDYHFQVKSLQTYSPIIRGLTSKFHRIQRLAPRYASGSVLHVKGGKGINLLEDELLAFPRSRYDDLSDCGGMLIDLAFPPEKKKEKPVHKMFTHMHVDKISGY